jgi:hypothetical protein
MQRDAPASSIDLRRRYGCSEWIIPDFESLEVAFVPRRYHWLSRSPWHSLEVSRVMTKRNAQRSLTFCFSFFSQIFDLVHFFHFRFVLFFLVSFGVEFHFCNVNDNGKKGVETRRTNPSWEQREETSRRSSPSSDVCKDSSMALAKSISLHKTKIQPIESFVVTYRDIR